MPKPERTQKFLRAYGCGGEEQSKSQMPQLPEGKENMRVQNARQVCCFFLQGKCTFRPCKFLHDDQVVLPCTYGQKCTNGHQNRAWDGNVGSKKYVEVLRSDTCLAPPPGLSHPEYPHASPARTFRAYGGYSRPQWKACRKEEVSENDLIELLLKMIDEQGGRLRPCKLFERNPRYKDIVEESGGVKAFCIKHAEIDFTSDASWGAGPTNERLVSKTQNSEELSAQHVIDEFLNLIDEHGGRMADGQVSVVYKRNPGFKAIVDADGGLKKFCLKSKQLQFKTDRMAGGWITRQSSEQDSVVDNGEGITEHLAEDFSESGWFIRSEEVSTQDVLDTRVVLIKQHGNKFADDQFRQWYEKNPKYQAVIDAVGGTDQFCKRHHEIEYVSLQAGSWWAQCCVESPSIRDVHASLLKVVDQLAASRLVEVCSQNPAFKAVLDDVGGMEKLCSYFSELEFATGSRGKTIVRRQQALSDLGKVKGDDEKCNEPECTTTPHKQVQHFQSSCVVAVKDLHWSRDNIKIKFHNGTLLAATLQDMLDNPHRIGEIPLMQVVELDGKFYVVDGNRRLWVFKEYEKLQKHSRDPIMIRVSLIDSASAWSSWARKPFTSQNGGTAVSCFLQRRHTYPTMTLALAAEIQTQCTPEDLDSASETDQEEALTFNSSPHN